MSAALLGQSLSSSLELITNVNQRKTLEKKKKEEDSTNSGRNIEREKNDNS